LTNTSHQNIGQQSRLISASKLCCPICWEFFDVWRGYSSTRLVLWADHSIVYPVQLPESVPDEVIQKLITRFQASLQHELMFMMSNPPMTMQAAPNGHYHPIACIPSYQSLEIYEDSMAGVAWADSEI